MRTKQAVTTYTEAKNNRDLSTAMAPWHKDGSFEAVPLGLRLKGVGEVRSFFEPFQQAFADYEGLIEGSVFTADHAAVWWQMTGTMSQSFLGFAATGQRISVPAVSIFTFADGQITGERMYFDLATLCDQAGIELENLRQLMGSLRTV